MNLHVGLYILEIHVHNYNEKRTCLKKTPAGGAKKGGGKADAKGGKGSAKGTKASGTGAKVDGANLTVKGPAAIQAPDANTIAKE